MWWKYDDKKKAKFVEENQWLLQTPLRYIISQSLAFGLLMFLFHVIYFTFFTEGRPDHWVKWLAFLLLCVICGGLYGGTIYLINRYYLRKFQAERSGK